MWSGGLVRQLCSLSIISCNITDITHNHHTHNNPYLPFLNTGLLDRPDGERNEMEKLTYASLAHLPTAVIYVIDPSGLSGEQHSSLEAQLRVCKNICVYPEYVNM